MRRYIVELKTVVDPASGDVEQRPDVPDGIEWQATDLRLDSTRLDGLMLVELPNGDTLPAKASRIDCGDYPTIEETPVPNGPKIPQVYRGLSLREMVDAMQEQQRNQRGGGPQG